MLKKIIFFLTLFLTLSSTAQKITEKANLVDSVDLQEVLVTANLPLNTDEVVDFYITNQFTTVDNITSRLEGLSLIKRGAYAMEPQVNGFSGGQLNVTIDGMRIFGACTDKMDPVTSYIEPTNLQNISVNHGTGSSETGSNIGGSIDLSLQVPGSDTMKTNHTMIGYGYESISRGRNLLFTLGLGKNKFHSMIDGVYRKNENYKDGNQKEVQFTQFEKINLHNSVRYIPDNINSYKTDILFDLAQNVGYPALPMDVSMARALLFAFEYQRKTNYDLKAKIYFNEIYHVMDDSKRDSLFLLEKVVPGKSDSVYMRMDMPGKSATMGAYVQMGFAWNEKNRLFIKADQYMNNSFAEMTMFMRYAGSTPEAPMYMQTWPQMLRSVTGIYAENSTFVNEKLTLSVNGRLDFNTDRLLSKYGQEQFTVFNYNLPESQRMFVKSLNITAKYRLSNQISFNASTGYGERLPTIGERIGYYLYNAYDGYEYIGNPYLKAEKSNFFRAGFQLTQSKLKINFSQSYSMIHDYIMGITESTIPPMSFYAEGIRVYANIDRASLYSSDLQILYSPVKSFTVFLSSKYTSGKINRIENMPLIAPMKNILALKYEKNNLLLQAEGESALAQRKINENYGESATPAYIVFNTKAGYEFSLDGIACYAGVGITNLLNRVYHEHLDWGRINRPGRNLEIYLKMGI